MESKGRRARPAGNWTLDAELRLYIDAMSHMYGLEPQRLVGAALEAFYCVTNDIDVHPVGLDRQAKARSMYRAWHEAMECKEGWATRWHEALGTTR